MFYVVLEMKEMVVYFIQILKMIKVRCKIVKSLWRQSPYNSLLQKIKIMLWDWCLTMVIEKIWKVSYATFFRICFEMAYQASYVFYVKCPMSTNWYVLLHEKKNVNVIHATW